MKVLEDPNDVRFRRWKATEGRHGQANEWTALAIGDEDIIPILDGIDWTAEVVDIGICSFCGGNCTGDLCVDWTLASQQVWLTPQIVVAYCGDAPELGRIQRPIVIAEALWTEWYEAGIVNAPVASARPTTHRELRNAWLGETMNPEWLEEDANVIRELRALDFVTEELEPEGFIDRIASTLDALSKRADEPLRGRIERMPASADNSCSAWFLDSQPSEWHALTTSEDHYRLTFEGGFVYVDDALGRLAAFQRR